jgi:hypothetical protein
VGCSSAIHAKYMKIILLRSISTDTSCIGVSSDNSYMFQRLTNEVHNWIASHDNIETSTSAIQLLQVCNIIRF